jgi:acyl-CoA thioester hydrolase
MSDPAASDRTKPRALRADFRRFSTVETRWNDNDVYGHVNNVVYGLYLDSVANRCLITEGGLDIHSAPVIGVVVESGTRFHASFAYPDPIEAGLAVGHLGRSSVRYELGLFAPGEDVARVDGWFVHVFVDRTTRRPAGIPERLRALFERLRR